MPNIKKQLKMRLNPTGEPSWPIDVINSDHHMRGNSSPIAYFRFRNVIVL